MKRNISDLLDGYVEEGVELYDDTPLSASRIKELTMGKWKQRQKEPMVRARTRRPLFRILLAAAVIVSLCCLTVFALVASLWDTAREDMGISQETPIAEWREYGDIERMDGVQQERQAALLATMCSGEQLYAYIAASPVPEEVAAVLAGNDSPQYEWDLGGTSPVGLGCTYHTEQTGYDPETQTALVKVYVHGGALKEVEQIELTLTLTHNLKESSAYGTVAIPVTDSLMLSCPADVAVKNTRAQFEAAWGSRPGMPDIPDYTSEGRINRITICAGYIEVALETPTLEDWADASNAGLLLDLEKASDLPVIPELEGVLVRRMFCGSWSVSVNEVLQGAVLNYRDGSSVLIEKMPRVYAGVWVASEDADSDAIWDGMQIYQFVPEQAFDLGAAESITIGDTKYTFPAMEGSDT
ncbi:hypothetical protein [Lawsonibacter celer]|uniref:hypothetical protein n=1 Tax=Lawsonibacter celer TaxID=2986526 RepID=UPI001649740D|nr:hypothetical protein [Lawsonibacter celer]